MRKAKQPFLIPALLFHIWDELNSCEQCPSVVASPVSLTSRAFFALWVSQITNIMTTLNRVLLSVGSRITPVAVCIPGCNYDAAVAFYKSSLNARIVGGRTPNSVVIESAFGFRVRINRVHSSSASLSSSRVSVQVKASADNGARFGHTVPASRVAYTLGNGGRVKHSRKGLSVMDQYGVRWTVAWLSYILILWTCSNMCY